MRESTKSESGMETRSQCFEESVMNEASCHRVAMLRNFDTKKCKDGLVNPTNVSLAHKALFDDVLVLAW